MEEIRIEHSEGVIAGSNVNAQGDVLVNGQKITNIYYSAQYKDLKSTWDKLETRFAATRQRAEQYPDNKSFQTELLDIDQERSEVQKKLDDLKREVIQLAETFTKISINTERLKLAHQHFKAGEFAAARAILNAQQMGDEQSALLQLKSKQQQQLSETEKLLVNNSNEFLILANLTVVDFDSPNRFNKAHEYFEQSIKAAHTFDNTLAYAYFLHQHNQFNAAAPFYLEALNFCRSLAEIDPQTYLPKKARILNNIGNLQASKKEFPTAQAAYQDALKINQDLAVTNPGIYLADVAITLNNLGCLHLEKKEFPNAEANFQKALKIHRTQLETNLSDLAQTLSNLGSLQLTTKEFPGALASYQEALEINGNLAKANPITFSPIVAGILNNIAVLQLTKNEFPSAEKALKDALEIYRRLTEINPMAYIPDRVMTAVNMSHFHQQIVPDRGKSLDYAIEALIVGIPFAEIVPIVQDYLGSALQIAGMWGLDREVFWKKAIKIVKNKNN